MKSTITKTIKALSIAVLIGTTNIVWADLAGNVVRVKGEASAKDASGKSRPLDAGSAVNEGDTISTAKESAVQLQMKDGALIAIAKESALKIQTYNFEESNGDANKVQLKLERGRLRTVTGDAPKDSYSLVTPVSTIKIQGTTFDVITQDGAITILRDGAVIVEILCDTGATNAIQLLDVPGQAVAISAPCKDPTSTDSTLLDVSDLDEILPYLRPYLTDDEIDIFKEKQGGPSSP